jgi:hypothetical protein
MNPKIFPAVAFAAMAATARADTGGTIDGATLSGMLLLAVLAASLLRTGVREWRREAGKAEPVRLRQRARRYNQP